MTLSSGHSASAAYLLDDASGLVVLQDRDGLTVVPFKPLHEGRGGVVRALHQGFVGRIVEPR